jgi:phosphatidate cytidylyltransferase
LRKKGSKLDLAGGGGGSGTGTESESTAPANSIVPPVPSLPKSTQQLNGAVKNAAQQVKETVQPALESVKQQAPSIDALKDQVTAALPKAKLQTPEIIETASSSDAETVPDYGDEDDSDLDDTSAPPVAAQPKPASPVGRAPSPPASKQAQVTAAATPEPYTGADHDPNKKLKAIITRTVWGLTMAGGAIGLVAMGHIYVIILVFVCQAVVYSELTNLFDAGYSGHDADAVVSQRDLERELRRKGRREERTKWSRRTSWCVD